MRRPASLLGGGGGGEYLSHYKRLPLQSGGRGRESAGAVYATHLTQKTYRLPTAPPAINSSHELAN